MSRQEIREAILGSKPKSTVVTLFGQEVELRQPTMGQMFAAQEKGTIAQKAARMIVQYAYVPGTDERIFEDGDEDALLSQPWGEDLINAQNAISKLNGIDNKALQAAVGNLEETQEE